MNPLQELDDYLYGKKEFSRNEMTAEVKEINIKHFKLKKFLGYRFQYIPEIDAFEFLPAYFRITYSPKPIQVSNRRVKLFIPFMKFNHGVSIGRDVNRYETVMDDGFKLKHVQLSRLRITLF